MFSKEFEKMRYSLLHQDENQNLANIHLNAFHGFFLSSLGKSFLNAYYKAALKNKETIAVCATDDNEQILGFGIGCVKSKGYHKKLIMQNPFTFLQQGLILIFKDPKALIRLTLNLDKVHKDIDDGNYAELISIGVIPACQGMGVGKGLIRIFEEEAKKKGCTIITLTTDFYNNEEAVSFYMHSGYKVFYEFTAYPKRRMYKLIKNLD